MVWVQISLDFDYENTWYYFFSTVAQSSAAFGAILVALALVKLQDVRDEILEIEQKLRNFFESLEQESIYSPIKRAHWSIRNSEVFISELKELFNRIYKRPFIIHTSLIENEITDIKTAEYLNFLILRMADKSSTYKEFRVRIDQVVFLSILIIVLSILFLPLIHIASLKLHIILFLIMVLLLVLLCIGVLVLIRLK